MTVSLSRLAGEWNAAPAVLVAAVLALTLFTRALVRLRARGRRRDAGFGRALLFVAGVMLATLALVSPLDRAGEEYLLSAHMLQHLLIGDVAPALLVLAVRGPLCFFLLPTDVLRTLARMRWLRALLSFLLRPVVSFGLWVLVLGSWHVPAAYDAALEHPLLHELEHASFVLAGLLVWTQIVDPARHGRLTIGQRAAYAAGLLFAGQVLADVLLASAPLYPVYVEQSERLLGLSPAADQFRAGLLMMAEQVVTLGTAAGLLLWAHVERHGLSGSKASCARAGSEGGRVLEHDWIDGGRDEEDGQVGERAVEEQRRVCGRRLPTQAPRERDEAGAEQERSAQVQPVERTPGERHQ